MVDRIKITDLDATASFGLADVLPAVRVSENRTVKVTMQQIADVISAILVDSAPATLDTLNELAAALGDDPNFATTVTNALALKADASELNTVSRIWTYRCGVGQVYHVDTSKTGAEIPPSNTSGPIFIELTAGLTGSGQFNNGKLTSESVSGSAPLVLATAVISFSGSPMIGQTIDLINTEGRMLRPSTLPGTKQNDALQNIVGSLDGVWGTNVVPTGPFTDVVSSQTVRPNAGTANPRIIGFDASLAVRTATETRMKNLGVKSYMRIK
jgi:hypothetical protein